MTASLRDCGSCSYMPVSVGLRKGIVRMAVEGCRVVDQDVDVSELLQEGLYFFREPQVKRNPLRLLRQVAAREIPVEREHAASGAEKQVRRGEADATACARDERRGQVRPGMLKPAALSS